ncbi:hypothetical protein EDB67_10498 [Vibrio crassostreae]|uniref:hypothetical protein n=1 Tax=Vibrio crassostreae TaxID=246167 RepID=UPI000F48A71F|nr:hypothetical protein [Vibrio crassostreae]ROR25448.1 hypothetical protein EDB67_10498 [Vibrio crassostreae]
MNKKVNINDIFESIDNNLIERRVPITYRYMDATREVSQYFGNIPIPISPNSLIPNNEFGNKLCIWLSDWYGHKYGDRQHYNGDLGVFYQIVQGDLWKYRVPNFYGRCNFFVSQDLSDKGGNSETNILRMCEDMTESYANRLSNEELIDIASNYSDAIEVFQIFNSWSSLNLRMYSTIRADFRNVSTQLDTHTPHYGQAKWAYLQAAEKIIKSWLMKSGLDQQALKKYGHNMHKLVNIYNKNYVQQISLINLEHISCPADARYEDETFSMVDTLNSQCWLFNLITTIGYSPKPL